ncbi:MAG: hypothetical protein LBP86_11560, partial [Azoarcus sp.]|nr:hypothetical protein [Azoarcus sp.]
MDGRNPFEALGVRRRQIAGIVVRNVKGAFFQQGMTCVVMAVIEGEQHQLDANGHGRDLFQKALHVGFINRARDRGAGAIHIEPAANIEQGIRWRRELRAEHDAAVAIADSRQMHMTIPDLGGVESLPKTFDSETPRRACGHGGAAGIDEKRFTCMIYSCGERARRVQETGCFREVAAGKSGKCVRHRVRSMAVVLYRHDHYFRYI